MYCTHLSVATQKMLNYLLGIFLAMFICIHNDKYDYF